MEWHKAYIGLGSNLEQPLEQIQSALAALEALPFSQNLTVSTLYRSKPVGPQNQPDFINGVACLETQMSPIGLLDELQKIELDQGRERKEHWGPRTLDLDLLLYDNQIIHTERLVVPHKELKNRSFVVIPLADVAPELVLPDGTSIQQLKQTMKQDLIPVEQVVANVD